MRLIILPQTQCIDNVEKDFAIHLHSKECRFLAPNNLRVKPEEKNRRLIEMLNTVNLRNNPETNQMYIKALIDLWGLND